MSRLMEIAELAHAYKSLFSSTSTTIDRVCKIGKDLKNSGFDLESQHCFELAVKGMLQLLNNQKIDQALFAENMIYASFVKTTEEESHYFNCFSLWSDSFKAVARTLGLVSVKSAVDTPRVSFVLQSGVLLGHTRVMFKVIDEWQKANPNVEIFVAVLGRSQPNFLSELDSRSVRLLDFRHHDGAALPPSQAIFRLREAFQALGIDHIVWVSVATWASFALALPLAPHQVFWSLKFHPVYVTPGVDVHICGGHADEDIRLYNGFPWRVCPFPLTVGVEASEPQEVRALRAQFPEGAVLLGSLARDEKFNAPEYLMCVAIILTENPACHFLFTGRAVQEQMKSVFTAYGVWSRCHFVGWVDTNLYAQVLDVFLETFPFGCGVTGFQAMGHGTPLLSFQAPDTMFGYQLAGSFGENFEYGQLHEDQTETLPILTAANSRHYIFLAKRLIEDVPYRNKIGVQERDYFESESALAKNYSQKLLNIIFDNEDV